jgi:hypothetical protein
MKNAVILLLISLCLTPCFGAQSTFDAEQNRWILNNGSIQASFQLTQEGYFRSESIVDLTNGDQWTSSPDQPYSLIRLQAGNDLFDAQRQYTLLDQFTQTTTPSGVRQFIVLRDLQRAAQITVILEMYDGQPVLRYGLKYRNLTASPAFLTKIDMLPWHFGGAGKRYTAFRINQWSVETVPADFESFQTALETDGTSFEVYSGAHGEQCSWVALHDPASRGLFAGWEFDGRAKATVQQFGAQDYLALSATVLDLNHPVNVAEDFQTPWGFVGLFHGDFDEAGYRTQQFVDKVLALPLPSATVFPYVSWDSWGYGQQIDEVTLRQNAETAAALGVELFIVDLGWARSIGDWYEDTSKFPNGIASLSSFVHSLGMKFGLHFALTEADPASPVLQNNPDWTSTETDNYHGATSLCLSNQPTQDWLVAQATRMIDNYQVDWILQDGENMVKQCTKTTHTHDPLDSNYANAVDGLNAVVSRVRAARPNVYWENCEDGGNMMTFNMVKNYVTSITNDASGSLDARLAVYGATYPFPPRYAERYMPDSDGVSPYAVNSYRFGGPWVLMNRLADLNVDQKGFLADQIARYKAQRGRISGGKVFHLAAPAANATDAIQSYDPVTDSALAVITRAQSDGPEYQFHPKGLNPNARYTVYFEIDPSVYSMGGAQLMTNGVQLKLPTPYSSDVVHIEVQQ